VPIKWTPFPTNKYEKGEEKRKMREETRKKDSMRERINEGARKKTKMSALYNCSLIGQAHSTAT
jgi:hypothetical protein